jgi:hypothetical protein
MLKSEQKHKQMHRQHGEIILQAWQEVVPSPLILEIKWEYKPTILTWKGKAKPYLWFMCCEQIKNMDHLFFFSPHKLKQIHQKNVFIHVIIRKNKHV